MHDRDKLCSEPGLHIMSYVFDHGGDGVVSREWRVHDNVKTFYL